MINMAYLAQANPEKYKAPHLPATILRGLALQAFGGDVEKYRIAREVMRLSDEDIIRNHAAEVDEVALEAELNG